MSDLAKVANLLSVNAIGIFQVSTSEQDAYVSARNLRRSLPRFEDALWEQEPTINVVPAKVGEPELRAPSCILWGLTESSEATDRLRARRPLPDVVLRLGSNTRLLAFWALEDELVAYQVEDANKRLCKYLNQGKYATADSGFRFPLPGAVLRLGRSNPVPVTLEHWRPAVHTLEEVVGDLPDPPTEEAKREMWEAAMERKAAAEAREKARAQRQFDQAAEIGHEH